MTGIAPIDLQGVRLSIEGRVVLHDLDLRAGERRVGIVGRNGSGKTTLARVIAGLIAPDSGRVRILGADVARDRKAALGTVGILFQNPDHQIIFPTVDEEMAFGLRQMGQSADAASARVDHVLRRFGKHPWRGASVHSLSQGQKQLLCLMAVLAMAPGVIVLDEPFSGLDMPTRLQLDRYLQEVPGMLVHITHDPTHLEDYDRVVWLDAGRIHRDGAPGDVLPAFLRRMTELGGGDDLTDLAG